MRTAGLDIDFLDSVLSHCATLRAAPYRETERGISGQLPSSDWIFGFDQVPDLFARFVTAFDQDDVLSFVERWGLPNSGVRQTFDSIERAATKARSLVSALLVLNSPDPEWAGTEAGLADVRWRMAFQRLDREASPSIDKLFKVFGPARLKVDEQAEAMFLGWDVQKSGGVRFTSEESHRLTLLDIFGLQAVQAAITGERIKRCTACGGFFIYQTGRPGVKGYQRKEAIYCSYDHARGRKIKGGKR